MTSWSLTPVDAQDRESGQVVESCTLTRLVDENETLRQEVAGWRTAWAAAVDERIATQVRLSKAMRVLASLGRLSPAMAALVSAARREVYGRLP